MRLIRAVPFVCLASALAACTSAPPASQDRGPRYTCCEANEIERAYQPGETLTIHWIVNPGTRMSGEIELNAHITGPYATADNLKASGETGSAIGGPQTVTAEPIHPTGDVGERPASIIVIPRTARPGSYNLVTSLTEPGATVSGASVIRVVSEP